MKTLWGIFAVMFLSGIIFIAPCCAEESLSEDSGTDADGKVISAKVLALRCQTSSKNPEISADCLNELAKDKKSDGRRGGYNSWDQESRLIINDYARSYSQQAAKLLKDGGEHSEKIQERTKDSGDLRAPQENNNKVVEYTAARFLDALDARGSDIVFTNVDNMVNVLVPSLAESVKMEDLEEGQ